MSTDTQTVNLTDLAAAPAQENKSPSDALRDLGERLIAEWAAAVAPTFPLPRPYLTAEVEDYRNQLHQFVDEMDAADESDNDAELEAEESQSRVWELEMLIEDALQAPTLKEARAILGDA